jgi:CBS domain-containing protein
MLAFYVLTGRLDFTVGVGLLDIFLRTPLYFFHERAWDKVLYGRTLDGQVESAIRTSLVTARPGEPVSKVIRRMVISDIGASIVVKDEKAIGLITERDILERVTGKGRDPSETFAKDIMSSPVATVEQNMSLIDILRMMQEKRVRRLVVTQDEKITGIVTERRILEALSIG